MGMYTELHFNVELKRDVPDEALALLQYMVNPAAKKADVPPLLPDHPLFKTARWDYMLGCDSYYFPADTHSTLRLDDIAKAWYLCIRCNLKNYDGEIGKFLDWVLPYADAGTECLGYYRYEENDDPTLIYKTRAAETSAEGAVFMTQLILATLALIATLTWPSTALHRSLQSIAWYRDTADIERIEDGLIVPERKPEAWPVRQTPTDLAAAYEQPQSLHRIEWSTGEFEVLHRDLLDDQRRWQWARAKVDEFIEQIVDERDRMVAA